MSSPFALFRKHQKILLVVLIGLSMLAFVIFGTISQVSDFRNMPPFLVVVISAAIVAAIAWVIGIPKHKSGEYGSIGLLIGAALGVGLFFSSRKLPAVTTTEFSLSSRQLNELEYNRSLANRFIYRAIAETSEIPEQFLPMIANQYTFGFGRQENIREDVMIGELLRREGEKLGISLSDVAVTNYIKKITDEKMTREKFNELRKEMNVSEQRLVKAIKSELFAREVANLLYAELPMPPHVEWEFCKRLEVRQQATVAGVPVRLFLDKDAEPDEETLKELFNTYRNNEPGFTAEGLPEEGRPGFRQPPRVRIAYLQPDRLKFEAQAAKMVTDEMIRARYEERYAQPAASPHSGLDSLLPGGPVIPGGPALPGAGSRPASPSPPEPSKKSGSSSSSKENAEPESPETTPPQKPEPESKSSPEPAPEKSGDSNAEKQPSPDKEEEATDAQTADECGDEPSESTDTSDGEDPEKSKPSDATEEKPSEDSSSSKGPKLPSSQKETSPPSSSPKSSGDSPTGQAGSGPVIDLSDKDDKEPPAPPTGKRLLDDELKALIREELQREQTEKLLEKVIVEATDTMAELGADFNTREDSDEPLTLEDVTRKAKTYAAAHDLIYGETILGSVDELLADDDHPIARASRSAGSGITVAEEMVRSDPKSLVNPRQIEVTDDRGAVLERYVYWKIEHAEPYVPSDMSDERVRNQVVEAWRELEAREKAQKRAAEIARLVRESDQEMMDVLSDVTVTGNPDDPVLTVTRTGQFSWLRLSMAPSPNPFQRFQMVPQLSQPFGLEQVGEDFMKIVFDELQIGDVGVAPSLMRTHYYIVKIDSRIPETEEEWEIVRNNFLAEKHASAQRMLSRSLRMRLGTSWQQELLKKYDVAFYDSTSG